MSNLDLDWKNASRIIQAFKELQPEVRQALEHYFEFLSIPPKTPVVKEGYQDTGLYFLLQGEAKIQRAGLTIGKVSPGQHFGELSLISKQPRSASIIAKSELILAKLSEGAFEKMKAENPTAALSLLQAIICSLGYRLVEMTDSYGMLLQERSLPRQTRIRVWIDGVETEIPNGAFVQDLLPAKVAGHPVVAAYLKNKMVGLRAQIFSETEIHPLTTAHWEGERVYRHSAGLLCLEAAYQLAPELEFSLGLAVGNQQWLTIYGGEEIHLDSFAQALEEKIEALRQEDVSFRQEIWHIEEAMTYFEQSARPDVSHLLQTYESAHVSLVSCGQHYILSTGPLLPSAGRLEPLKIQITPVGLVLHTHPQDTHNHNNLLPYAKIMQSQERWLCSLDMESVGKFNQACINGEVTQMIRVAEGYHEKRISQIADQIAAMRDTLRVICIAGPSSSGKTTFIKRLNIQLQVNGFHPKGISLDDYYLNRELTPRDESGELDFEALAALNLELLGEHLLELLAGKNVKTARYNFVEGLNHPQDGPEIRLQSGDLLMLEGIHGLNPALLPPEIPDNQVFRIFIQPMAALAFDNLSRVNPSDLRLLRRIVRDRHQRGTTPGDNILRWASVRRGEQKYIFPFVQEADALFDTSLVYELAVLKVLAERYLLEVPVSNPAYATAYRLRKLLNLFVPIAQDHVPQTSILREFIGKSGFDY